LDYVLFALSNLCITPGIGAISIQAAKAAGYLYRSPFTASAQAVLAVASSKLAGLR
jgi:hypothetical protein